jgi:hypothetical protein
MDARERVRSVVGALGSHVTTTHARAMIIVDFDRICRGEASTVVVAPRGRRRVLRALRHRLDRRT